MGLMKRSTPEEKEAQRQAKDAQREAWAEQYETARAQQSASHADREGERATKSEEKQRQREEKAREKLKRDFFASPAGQARTAFENQKHVFQVSLDLVLTEAIVVIMMGAYSKPKSTTDPTDILNSVCEEGWELVTGSVVFLETGSESRDKFLASGQHIAVSGTIMGYYLFRRCEANIRRGTDPWEAPSAVEQVASGSEVVT